MSQGVWKCDSCHSNNDADMLTCHLCHRAPGSATGEVPTVTHQQLTETQRRQPNFVEYRPTITLAPAPPRSRPAVPVRPAPTPPSGGKAAGGCGLVAIIIVIVGIVIAIMASRGTGGSSATPPQPGAGITAVTTTTAAGPACPAEVAQFLPLGGSNSTLVARWDAPLHVVTICQDSGGQLYYDGQARGEPATDQYHISLKAWRTSTGFEADNGGYKYVISGSDLDLSNNGVEVTNYPLTPSN